MHIFFIILYCWLSAFSAYATEVENEEAIYFSVASKNTISLYAEPSTTAAVIAQIPAQAVAIQYIQCDIEADAKNLYTRVMTGKRGWCQVAYLGFYGWAQKELLHSYTIPTELGFDCTPNKRKSTIEEAICNDFELTNLEITMASTFAHAMQKATLLSQRFSNQAKLLQTAQKQWEKSRNECMNKEHWEKITCLTDRYQIRLTYLQAKWGLVRYADAQRFVCGGKPYLITYYDTSYLASLTVNDGAAREVMIDYMYDSETRYVGDSGRYLLINGNQARLKWQPNRPEITCKQQ